jgi:hypothetical protein
VTPQCNRAKKKRKIGKKEEVYIPSSGHDLGVGESDGANEVVIVVKQWLLPGSFQPGKVIHCIKPAQHKQHIHT